MRIASVIWLLTATGGWVSGQTTTGTSTISGVVVTTTDAGTLTELPTGPGVTYISYNSTITLSPSAGNATSTAITSLSRNSTLTQQSTTTSSAARPSNTQPCNNHVELCERKYSNITNVAAHNFAFAKKGNVASNQQYGPTDQLNDGIRMLQGQTRYVNNTVYYCHSSCNLLNVGTAESVFREIAQWVEKHPYDVITILIGNGDYIDVNNYTAPIQNSGLGRYVYRPSQIPMTLGSWPTLSEMILLQQRVVLFMDYQADQNRVPYILDEFSQLWETPFSPTNASFPCNVQRPPNLPADQARNRLYMANHNLNVAANLLSVSILLPNTAFLNQTNAQTGFGSLGVAKNTCQADWGRPPNFLLVDYYNYGNFPGSVFAVAAEANGLTYDRKCCGSKSGSISLAGFNTSIQKLLGFYGLLFLASLVS